SARSTGAATRSTPTGGHATTHRPRRHHRRVRAWATRPVVGAWRHHRWARPRDARAGLTTGSGLLTLSPWTTHASRRRERVVSRTRPSPRTWRGGLRPRLLAGADRRAARRWSWRTRPRRGRDRPRCRRLASTRGGTGCGRTRPFRRLLGGGLWGRCADLRRRGLGGRNDWGGRTRRCRLASVRGSRRGLLGRWRFRASLRRGGVGSRRGVGLAVTLAARGCLGSESLLELAN